MKDIPLYKFYRHKYGSELLIDVLTLDYIRDGIRRTPIHRETFYCIIMFTDGQDDVAVNGCKRRVRPGEVVCSRPGEVWQWHADTTLDGYMLIFEEQFLLSFFNDDHFLDHFAYLQPDRPSPFLFPDATLQKRLLHLFKLMKSEIEDSANKDQHILRAMLYETLMLLNRAENAPADGHLAEDVSTNRYIDKFVHLVGTDFGSHHDVAYYADKLCITPNYLNKIITSHFGKSSKQYINDKLADEAKRLLAYTTLSINEISGRLHFDESSYFVRFFRKMSGQTPSQFRASSRA